MRAVGLMRTTGKRVKKTMCFAVISLVLAGTLCGCSDIVNKQPLYVYGFGLDTREAGVMLYVLCGEGGGNSGGKGSGKSGGNGGSGGSSGSSGNEGGSSGSDQAKESSLNVLSFAGKDTESAFENFFSENGDVYTGTVEAYLLGAGVDKKTLDDFKVYLVNSNKLPLKRNAYYNADPYSYFVSCAKEADEETVSEMLETDGVNVIRFSF